MKDYEIIYIQEQNKEYWVWVDLLCSVNSCPNPEKDVRFDSEDRAWIYARGLQYGTECIIRQLEPFAPPIGANDWVARCPRCKDYFVMSIRK